MGFDNQRWRPAVGPHDSTAHLDLPGLTAVRRGVGSGRHTERCAPHRTERSRARQWWRGHRPETRRGHWAYTQAMGAWQNPNEDERGVDVGQIRRQLTMSVEDRVRHMVDVANAFMKIRDTVKRVDGPLGR